MARKKKNLKDINEHETSNSSLQDPPAQKRANLDEYMSQEQQQQQDQNSEQQKNEQQQLYTSDSEIIDLKQKNLHVEKNKSNLFLIKSYSFIDKSNAKRPKNLNIKNKLEEFEKYHTLMLEEASPTKDNPDKSVKSEKISKVDKSEKSQKSEKSPKSEKFTKVEKTKKTPKLKKLKKSKSTYDSAENLQDFRDILRKPSIILEGEQATFKKRPQSMPVTQNQHKPVIKSKTLEDLETSHIKRESFIRHSLQSIRRSFSSSKKHPRQHHISFTSSSSSSSSASDNTSSLKKSKSKDFSKDIGNLKDVEDDHKDLLEDNKNALSSNSPCNIVIKVNDVQSPEEPNHHLRPHLKDSSSSAVLYSATSPSAVVSPPSSMMYQLDSLAVLKEEDEKDLLSSWVNIATDNKYPPCVITEQRSTSSVSTLAQLPPDSIAPMAPLQTHTECQSVQCLNTLENDFKSSSSSSSPPQQQKSKRVLQHQLSTPDSLHSTSIGCATSSEYSSARSLKHSSTSLAPLQTLNSSGSLRSISPSRRSASSNSSSTAKHEQSSAAATAAAAATATTSNATTTPPEKEKKRKEVSSSRVKKFHRHFSQVSKDEKLINYFSCALVSDILLQGHLYITDHHFAFYSNVFGYVTKVVIPTNSVTKISKEKTAKIIPNAVGVATADERHVFGSFISREAAFRLMCSVCPPLGGVAEILPKDPAQIDITEEYSIEDDSSCSISGNESPAQTSEIPNSTHGNHDNDTSQTILRRSVGSSNLSIAESSNADIPSNAKTATNTASLRAPGPSAAHFVNSNGGVVNLVGLKSVLQPALAPCGLEGNLTIIAGTASTTTTSATSTPTPSTTSSPTTVMNLPSSKVNHIMNIFGSASKKLMDHIKFPTEIHVVYMGVMLTLLLAVFSIFLLYRILDIEAKTSAYRSPVEFNWRSGNDDDIFTEALRFQKQLQLKSTEEAQNILKTNLEQIAKVRRSLETLSMLIHDRSSSFVASNADDSD